MRRIFKIYGLNGDPVGSLGTVGGESYWRALQDLVAAHFLCDPDDVGSTEPTDEEPDEFLTIDGHPVAFLAREWLR